MTNDTEIVEVASAERMDKTTFAKHFTHRHDESLAGMTELPGTVSDAVIDSYRAFHRQLHRTRVDLEHFHND
jgi:hypothetical protein